MTKQTQIYMVWFSGGNRQFIDAENVKDARKKFAESHNCVVSSYVHAKLAEVQS